MIVTALVQNVEKWDGAIIKERLAYLKAGLDPIPVRFPYLNAETAVRSLDLNWKKMF